MENHNKALSVPLPSPMDFGAYERAVQSIPMLTLQREVELIKLWRQDGDRDAARELVLAHLRLVTKSVKDHRGYGLPDGDLAQEGTVGLMKAVHGFDPKHGVRLASYAWKWIEAEIREYIFRSWRLVRLGSGSTMKKLFFGYRKTMEELRKWSPDRVIGVSPEDVASAMNIEPSHALIASQYFRGQDISLVSNEEDQSRDDEIMLEALPYFGNEQDPQDIAEKSFDENRAKKAMAVAWQTLDERSQQVLIARRMREPSIPLKDLSSKLGVSIERARQIEHAAWDKLVFESRKHLGNAITFKAQPA